MKLFYGLKDDEVFYRMDKQELQEKIDSLEDEQVLIEMKYGKYSEFNWCAEEGDWVSSDSCGKNECPAYHPCNGISGKCRFLRPSLVATGKEWEK